MDAQAVRDRRSEFESIFATEDRFRAWYDVAARRLYAYLVGRCGGDGALAEELTQQSFVLAVKARDTFDGRSDPITWLIAIGRNRLVDHLRREEREERRRLRLVVREIAPSTIDNVGWIPDDRAEVLRVLRRLPASQRSVLILHHVDGLPVRQIAIMLERTEGAVEALLSRGRARFREIYGEVGHG